MNPYQQFVTETARLLKQARLQPLGGFPSFPQPVLAPNAPRILVFSPHPDDEVIIGGVALRLLRESGWRVVNVAVTLGSKQARQAGRLEELRACCQCIGFDLTLAGPSGLEGINPRRRQEDPAAWQSAVHIIAGILRDQAPRAILFPHDQDWNSTHVGVHWLVRDALELLGPGLDCLTLETEFWGAMATPNLMVELTPEHLGDLITALTFHVGEVQRNPYHLTLPAWMIDNVRRGAELVGGQGGASPDFTYATLYRVRHWTATGWNPLWTGGRTLPHTARAGDLLSPH
jgi:N-acetylglucosamine malate deacetylase 1